ncbi:uncharacterized protein [Parasteatoda tepidariorum]|uniref:uncharacterized protein n=1 Tax=Parasteatoda tepidariorum TaxID=114398 RepID=UPI0039BC84F9
MIAPRRPSGNGQAERTAETVKDALRRIVRGNWRKRLAKLLLQQHCTPTTTISARPAELLMRRKLRTVLDRLHPDLTTERKLRQEQDAYIKNADSLPRSFSADDPVFVRNYGQGPKGFSATVIKPTGPVSYQAVTTVGEIVKRHVDQMRRRIPDPLTVPSDPSVASPPAPSYATEVPSSIPSSADSQSVVV